MMPMIQLSNLPRKPGPHQDGWLPYSNLLLLPFRNIKMLIFAAAAAVLFYFLIFGVLVLFQISKEEKPRVSLCVCESEVSVIHVTSLPLRSVSSQGSYYFSFVHVAVFVVWCCDCFDFRLSKSCVWLYNNPTSHFTRDPFVSLLLSSP